MSLIIVYPEVSFDSWVSVDDANTYFENRLRSVTWESATDANKEFALLRAYTRMSLLNLKLPTPIDDATLTKLKTAQMEQAIHELRYDLDYPSGGVTAVDLDGVKVNWNKSQVQQYPDIVLGLLREFIQMKTVKVVR